MPKELLLIQLKNISRIIAQICKQKSLSF